MNYFLGDILMAKFSFFCQSLTLICALLVTPLGYAEDGMKSSSERGSEQPGKPTCNPKKKHKQKDKHRALKTAFKAEQKKQKEAFKAKQKAEKEEFKAKLKKEKEEFRAKLREKD
jgi:hypothetical protein